MIFRGVRRGGLRLGANPIIIKELRSRMRGPRAFLVLTGFLLLLAAVTFLLYRVVLETVRFTPGPLSATVGQSMFAGLAFFELFLIIFITPALTAGTVSGEHEAQTYEMLVATPLRPVSILWGKLIAALSYVFLLIFAAVPLASLVLIFGGVTIRDMLTALLVLVVSAITFGTVGVFYSALLNRTGRATVLSYLTLLFFILGPLFLYVFVGIVQQREPPRGILLPSPFTAVASVMAPSQSGGFFGPLGFFFGLMSFGVGFVDRPTADLRPMWHFTLGFYVLLTVVLFVVSTQLIKPVGRRLSWRAVLAGLALLLLLGGVGSWLYPLSELRTLFGVPATLVPIPMDRSVPAMPAAPYPVPLPTATPAAAAPAVPYPGPEPPPTATAEPAPPSGASGSMGQGGIPSTAESPTLVSALRSQHSVLSSRQGED
ncbi:MAG TPA: hypothetical protein DEP84_08930 [Chloroflexi bacterium]|nr:hypothetical protein [Chloroflexota bacterium]